MYIGFRLKANFMPGANPCQARQTALSTCSLCCFLTAGDKQQWHCLVHADDTECPFKLQQLRAVMPRPQGLWQTRVARGSSCKKGVLLLSWASHFGLFLGVFFTPLLQCAPFLCSALHLLLFLSLQVTASPPFCRCCTLSARTSLSQTCCLDSSLMGQWG